MIFSAADHPSAFPTPLHKSPSPARPKGQSGPPEHPHPGTRVEEHHTMAFCHLLQHGYRLLHEAVPQSHMQQLSRSLRQQRHRRPHTTLVIALRQLRRHLCRERTNHRPSRTTLSALQPFVASRPIGVRPVVAQTFWSKGHYITHRAPIQKSRNCGGDHAVLRHSSDHLATAHTIS